MTVIVPQALPAHISLPTLPTQQLDIAYSPAPAPDPSTPRVVLAHAALDIVAAAVTLAPALSPALPPENPEYCLSSKRKAVVDDPLDVPRISKRARAADDVLFGSLPDTPPAEVPSAVSNDVDPMQATFEQALAAILSYSPTAQVLDSTSVSPPPTPQPEPPSHASSSRITHSPLAASIDPAEAASTTVRPLARISSPPRNRIVEPSLWKMACRTRVDQIISTHGGQAIRATVAQENRSRASVTRHTIVAGVPRRSTPAIVDSTLESELELEIYTPFTYPQLPEVADKEDASISDAESDIDMSFDLDDDSDTDSDTEEDSDIELLSAHESILDVPVGDSCAGFCGGNESSAHGRTSISPPPIGVPSSIAIESAPPSWPPRLPNLSSLPAYCLREYPQMERMGTPTRNSPLARGSLLHRCCRFKVPRSSDRTSIIM